MYDRNADKRAVSIPSQSGFMNAKGDMDLPRQYGITHALQVLKVSYTPYRTLPINTCISDQQQVSLISIGMWSSAFEVSLGSLPRVATPLYPP